jgi:hypothetical protein
VLRLSNPIFQQKEFWTDYFFLSQANEGLFESAEISLPLPDRHSLLIRFTPALQMISLGLMLPSGDITEIGWDDQAHFHPHALRWEELETIVNYAVRSTESLFVSELPFLLLYRFSPITQSEVGFALPRIERVLKGIAFLRDYEIGELTKLSDCADRDVQWELSSDGLWYVYGADAYSLRVPENDQFPFQLLQELVSSARSQQAD